MIPMNLKPWFANAIPHEDIRQGRLSEAIFAADLLTVVQNSAPEIYLDPEAFFSKTYLTTGLSNVLRKVSRALSGNADAGDRILSLQTSFGGGKTHSLVALYHLAKHTDQIRQSSSCAEVRKALSDQLPSQVKSIAIFTNKTCDATQGRQTPEGIHTQTLWGELALQLGGVELYRKVEANDKARSCPQGLFVEILRSSAPCLILIDELADYCVGASAVEYANTTLADQTISFVQQLTEAVNQVNGVAVVATLPASHLEVASSERGQEILNTLERRFGRMGADVKPVADDEIYEVVRRRLFDTLGDPAEHEKVADAYMRMYDQHKNDVPTEATRGTYKERLMGAYPFHPTLIDAFYLRWGSHSDFQRTRGILRLMASLIGDLWQRRNTETQSQPLIQPCHIRWTIDALHSALTRLWGSAYESVIAADVIGDKSNAILLDEEHGGDYSTERITQGVTSSILLGSFGGQGERAGYSTKDLRLCVSRPNVHWNYMDNALLGLEERGFYLYDASAGNLGKRYWFGAKPRLTKLIVQYRGQFSSENFNREILDTLKEQIRDIRIDPATWRIIVNPEADLPEQKSLTLLIMPPENAYSENGGGMNLIPSPMQKFLMDLSSKCGSRERLYRNILLFLLPSSRGLTKLRNAIREVEALEAVKRDYNTQLDAEDRDDLKKRLETARKSVVESIGSAYIHIARIEENEVSISTLNDAKSDFSDHLRAVWNHVIEDEEWVLRKVGTVTLQKVGLVPEQGGIRIKDSIEAFIRYTDKPMIANRDAVIEGLKQACKDGLIGIGRGMSIHDLQKKWCREDVMLDPNEEGLWIIPPFKPEPVITDKTDTAGTTQPSPETDQMGKPDEIITPPPTSTNQVNRITISGNVSMENWSEIFRCFITTGRNMNLKKLQLGINFEMEAQDGVPLDESDPKVKAMEEAARQLGLEFRKQ